MYLLQDDIKLVLITFISSMHEQNENYIVYLVFVRIDFLHFVTYFVVSKIKIIDSCLYTHII